MDLDFICKWSWKGSECIFHPPDQAMDFTNIFKCHIKACVNKEAWNMSTMCISVRRVSTKNFWNSPLDIFNEKDVATVSSVLFCIYEMQYKLNCSLLWSLYYLFFFFSFTESRYCNRSINYNIGERRGDWLLKAIYESGDIHNDQEASEIQARSVFISWSISVRNLDVHCFCLHWGQCSFIPGQQI